MTANNESDEIRKLQEKVKSYGDAIKKLHGINEMNKNKYAEEVNELKEQLEKKEEECKGYIEKIKAMERRNEEVYKNVTSGNISDLNEIKKQFDRDRQLLNELIKTYKHGLDEKSEIIAKNQEEINCLKNELDEERKKNESLGNIINDKFDSKSSEIQFFKISTENSALKTKLINAEEKIEKLIERVEKLKNERNDIDLTTNTSLDLMKKELSFKSESYSKLLKDYQSSNQILTHCQDDFEKAKYFNEKYEKENMLLEKKVFKLDNEVTDLRAENQGLTTRLKGNEIELESNRAKIKEYESQLAEYKFSKQVFDVTYIYLRMSIEGKIIFQKEGDQYSIAIANRTNTRRYSFLDVDIVRDIQDSNKIYVKFIKENNQEEYYCNEAQKLIEYYNEYKRRAIEVTDFSSSNIRTDKTKVESKKKNVEKELQGIFDF